MGLFRNNELWMPIGHVPLLSKNAPHNQRTRHPKNHPGRLHGVSSLRGPRRIPWLPPGVKASSTLIVLGARVPELTNYNLPRSLARVVVAVDRGRPAEREPR
jgi:hypothetical protein